MCRARNFPLDIFLVQDDDIPAFLVNDVCQLGIIGQNSLLETQRLEQDVYGRLEEVVGSGFGRCRLSIARCRTICPMMAWEVSLERRCRHAGLLAEFLAMKGVVAEIVTMEGAVEDAAALLRMRSAILSQQATR